jgi:glycogen debranching enzyme
MTSDAAPITRDSAQEILRANDRGGYTVPNANVYPFQWNWDSAFVALGFQTFDEARAWSELETLFLGQWDDGMVPHIVFHRRADGYYPGPAAWGTHHTPPTSGISQPPVAASAAQKLFRGARDAEAARARAKELLPKLMAWHRWWHETRDPDRSGLVTCVHPWESGRDNLPDWDAPLAAVTPVVDVSALRKDLTHVSAAERPTHDFYNRVMTLVEQAKALGWDGVRIARESDFRVCDLGIQCILSRADRDLHDLAWALEDDAAATEIGHWIARSDAALGQLRADDGSFRSLDLRTHQLSPAVTSATFLPLYARAVDQQAASGLARLFERWLREVRFAVPSTDPDFKGFDPQRYWRGPVWLVMNFMIADGFAAYGYSDIATRIRADSAELVRASGLREYFDPRNGDGLGGRDFSWSAAVVLCWELAG